LGPAGGPRARGELGSEVGGKVGYTAPVVVTMCAVCEKPETVIDPRTRGPVRLGVYHDRACCPGDTSCGECVLDLLCRRCDAVLALARDDPKVLRGMAAYLRFWSRHQRDANLNIVEKDRAMPAGVPLSLACALHPFGHPLLQAPDEAVPLAASGAGLFGLGHANSSDRSAHGHSHGMDTRGASGLGYGPRLRQAPAGGAGGGKQVLRS